MRLTVVAPSVVSMYVGETRDLMTYIDVVSGGGKISFSSSDDDVVRIDGTVARAVSAGNATVTVRSENIEAGIDITVEYRAAGTLEIECNGDTVQNVAAEELTEEVTPVTFSAVYDDYIDPQAHAEWFVDGKAVASGDTCVFTPTRFGEFTVAARLQGLTAEKSVKVYRKTEAVGKSVGALEQTRDFSPVVFTAYEEIDTRNPRSVVEWKVNGTTASTDKTFEFTPTAQGRYDIELFVNGAKRKIDGKDGVTVVAVGERAPSCALKLDADGVYVEWRDGARARSVVIVDPHGVRTAYSSSDISCAYRFGDGVFDATGLIEATAQSPADYSITVSAEAPGQTLVFTQYGDDAREYIENKVFINNAFIDCAARAAEFVQELYACGKRSATAYIARGADAESIVAAATARARELGIIGAEITADGNKMTVELGEFFNAPTENAQAVAERVMYSVLPHIEYDESNRRPSGYALAVDRKEKTVGVSGSEQLLLAVMRGYKPVPTAGSVANGVFGTARRTLISIIGKDYSDFQKVHAVYDWLQWTAYRADIDTADTEYSSNYLESVFYVGGGRPSCAVTSLGAAKAFALLCSMEGIRTEIVPIERDGTYYYIDKVMVDGAWYNVDAYGGEYEMSASREHGTHERLLIDDNAAQKCGIYTESEHAAFDGGETYYLQKHVDGDKYYDCFVAATEADDYATLKAAVYGAFDGTARGKVDIFTVTGVTSIMNETLGAELMLDAALDSASADKIIERVVKAANEYAEERFGAELRDGAISAYIQGRTLHVTAVMPRADAQSQAAE